MKIPPLTATKNSTFENNAAAEPTRLAGEGVAVLEERRHHEKRARFLAARHRHCRRADAATA
jgi:hypothetical protein